MMYSTTYAQNLSENYSDALRRCSEVKSLTLNYDHDGTEKIDNRIASLKLLEELVIIDSKGSEIDLPIELKKLQNLKSLRIVGSKLTKIPPIIYELSSLESLSLEMSEVKTVSDDIGNLIKLKYLGIGSLRLSFIPESIYRLRNLEHLYISADQIKSLPDGISKLVNLEYLRVHTSNLTSLPKDINKLEKLKELDFYCRNPIQISLDSKVQKIEFFRWGGCPIFPNNICEIISIKDLMFDAGKIETIPTCIANMKNLEKLEFSNHPINSIPLELLELKKLKFLSFFSTQIDEIDTRFFEMPNIIDIDLRLCERMKREYVNALKEKYSGKVLR